jgi:DNA-binding PadR family transcriptional regulator
MPCSTAEAVPGAPSEGPRRRRTYRATESGIEEVRRWLTAVEVDHTLRLEPVLRSVFFWLMTPEELAAHLEKEAAFYRDLAEKYRAIAAAKDRGEYGDTPQTESIRTAAEAGIRLHEALGDWATWAVSHPPNVLQ